MTKVPGVAYAVIALGLLALIWALWWFLIIRPADNAARAATASAQADYAEARTESAQEANMKLDEALRGAKASEDLSKVNEDAIRKAPGADQRLDPAVNAAGRRGLCNRAAYRDRPECVQLARRAQPSG